MAAGYTRTDVAPGILGSEAKTDMQGCRCSHLGTAGTRFRPLSSLWRRRKRRNMLFMMVGIGCESPLCFRCLCKGLGRGEWPLTKAAPEFLKKVPVHVSVFHLRETDLDFLPPPSGLSLPGPPSSAFPAGPMQPDISSSTVVRSCMSGGCFIRR